MKFTLFLFFFFSDVFVGFSGIVTLFSGRTESLMRTRAKKKKRQQQNTNKRREGGGKGMGARCRRAGFCRGSENLHVGQRH
jgi:hypothetical protein